MHSHSIQTASDAKKTSNIGASEHRKVNRTVKLTTSLPTSEAPTIATIVHLTPELAALVRDTERALQVAQQQFLLVFTAALRSQGHTQGQYVGMGPDDSIVAVLPQPEAGE